MRPISIALLLSFATPLAHAADAPPAITLKIGEEKSALGIMPRCDDLTVVAITADGRGVRGVRPGRTLCSFDTSGGGGARQVYQIVVVAAEDTEREGTRSRASEGTQSR